MFFAVFEFGYKSYIFVLSRNRAKYGAILFLKILYPSVLIIGLIIEFKLLKVI